MQIPVGGVHREVLSGNGQTRVNTTNWGITTHSGGYELPTSWKTKLSAPQTLRAIVRRRTQYDEERVIAREVRGEWFAGALDLPLEDVHDVLWREGYDHIKPEHPEDEMVTNGRVDYRVLVYRHQDVPAVAAPMPPYDPAEPHPPIDGVPDSAFKLVAASLNMIGQLPSHNRKGWVDELKRTTKLSALRARTRRPNSDYLVSEQVDSAWLVGRSQLDRDLVVAELTQQGYESASDTLLGEFRVERFDRSSEIPSSTLTG